jgi:hypothetical protein
MPPSPNNPKPSVIPRVYTKLNPKSIGLDKFINIREYFSGDKLTKHGYVVAHHLSGKNKTFMVKGDVALTPELYKCAQDFLAPILLEYNTTAPELVLEEQLDIFDNINADKEMINNAETIVKDLEDLNL